MALVLNRDLPSFSRIRKENISVITFDQVHQQNLKRIALLNIMPDKALQATERQFMRLLGSHSDKEIEIYFFHIDGIDRNNETLAYIKQYYLSFEEVKNKPLDALIISGTNVPEGEMSKASFWQSLTQVFNWALSEQIKTLFACLATHAAIEYFYQQKRQLLAKKCWGVFTHQQIIKHPLTASLVSPVLVPHSRFNTITQKQMESVNIKALLVSEQAGVHLAVSEEHPFFTFFQGHPEYDDISLLKEYKREIARFLNNETTYPDCPENYFDEPTKILLKNYRKQIEKSFFKDSLLEFPENEISQSVRNNWFSSGKKVVYQWLNII